MVETTTAAIGTPEVEPTAFGLDAGGWVAMAMIAVIGIMIWQKVPALIASMLDKRIGDIRSQLDAATTLRAEAETLKSEYEAKAKAMVADAAAVMAHANTEAKALIAQAEIDTKALIARRSQMATDKIAAAERAALADVRARAAEASTAAARKLIIDGHGAAQDKALISEAIARLN